MLRCVSSLLSTLWGVNWPQPRRRPYRQEAQYLVGFRTADEIRNLLLKAKKKLISDYVQKELQGSLALRLAELKKAA